jgi:hypothetical protein
MLLQGLQGGVSALLGLPSRQMLGLAGVQEAWAAWLELLLSVSSWPASENSPAV